MSHTLPMSSLCLFGLLLLVLFGVGTLGNQVYYEEGYTYKYQYSSLLTLQGAGDFHITSQVLLQSTGQKIDDADELHLHVQNYKFVPNEDPDIVGHDLDFSGWFSIVITRNGEIKGVFYPDNDTFEVISVKKGLASLISGRFLHANEAESVNRNGDWSYNTQEIGHEGTHNSTYSVTPTLTGRIYKKTRVLYPHHQAPHAKSDMKKYVHFDDILGTVHTVDLAENLQIKHSAQEGFDPYTGMRDVQAVNGFDNVDYPEMNAHLNGQLVFVEKYTSSNIPQRPSSLVLSSIENDKTNGNNKGQQTHNITETMADLHNNLTCIRQQPHRGSTTLIDCFSSVVDLLLTLPDDELETIADTYLENHNAVLQRDKENQHSILDGLWAMQTPKAQQLLTSLILANNNTRLELLQRLLYHIATTEHLPDKSIVSYFEKIMSLEEDELHDIYDTETFNQLMLTVGAVSHVLRKHGYITQSLYFNSRLKDRLGLHDPWTYRKRRSTLTEREQIHYDLRHVILLEALGNERHEESLEHIVSHINSTNSAWIKRSAIHALRHYTHQKAVITILEAALSDDNEEVRYEAVLQYQAHPKSAYKNNEGSKNDNVSFVPNMDAYNQDVFASTHDLHSIHRRGILDKEFKWRLEAPSVDWRKVVGTNAIGASIGVIMINYFDLQISPLKGHFKIQVHDEVYARAHLGIVGINYDFFVGRICFKGGAEYNLNILQEYDPSLNLENVKLLTKGLQHVVSGIKDGVDIITNTINGRFTFKSIVEDFLTAFRELPKRVLQLRETAFNVMTEIGELVMDNIPPFIQPVKDLVLYVTNLFNNIKTDVMAFYNLLVQTIETIIPNAAERIFTAVKDIIEEFPNILKDPKTAVGRIGKCVVSISLSIKELQRTKKEIEGSSFVKGDKPDWMNIDDIYEKVVDMATKAFTAVREQGQTWVDELEESDDPLSTMTGGVYTERKIRQMIKEKVDSIIQSLLNPFENLKGLGSTVLDQFVKLFGLVSDVKEGYNKLKIGFRAARAIIDKVFGPKCHKDFPKRLREDECQGNGFFPSKLGYGNEYRLQGVDLNITEGSTIVAPLSGIAVLTGHSNEVMILNVTELPTGQELIIMNIQPNSDIYHLQDSLYIEKQVSAGDSIGTATNSPCTNHLHFVLLEDGGVIDPSRLLAPRPPEKPEWRQICDDYKIVKMGITTKAGSIVGIGGRREEDTSGNLPDDGTTPNALDKTQEPSQDHGGGMYDNLGRNKRRRKRNDFIDEAWSKIDALVDRTAAFLEQFSIRRIKMGTIVTFLHKLEMNNSLAAMTSVINRIKTIIDDTPCKAPSQMTNDELGTELLNRGYNPSGSREQMIKTLTKGDQSCPNLVLAMPDVVNMFCSFDDECLGMQCCMTFTVANLLQKTYKAYIRFEPETLTLNFGFGNWEKSVVFLEDFEDIDKIISTDVKFELLNLEVICRYQVDKVTANFTMTFGCGLCSSDNTEECLVFEYLLQDALFSIPTLSFNGTLSWPSIDYRDYFDKESVKTRLLEEGEKLIEEVKERAADELFEALGLPEEYLKNNPRCPIPENMLDTELEEELEHRNMSTDGDRDDRESRLRAYDLTCRTLSGNDIIFPDIADGVFSDIFYYKVSKHCYRMDACLDVTLPVIDVTKTFTAYIELDPCDFKLYIGIERWTKTIWLIDYKWDTESKVKLTDAIFIRYTIDKDDDTDEFVVTVGIVFEAIAFDTNFIDSKRIPIPVCNADFKLPGAGDLKSLAEAIGSELTQEAFDLFIVFTGLDDIIMTDSCTLPDDPKNCSVSVSDFIPDILQDIVRCKMLDNCWGVSCCIEFSFNIPLSENTMEVAIPLMIHYDPCKYFIETRIGTEHYFKQWFVDYSWGETSSVSIGKGFTPPVEISYVIDRFDEGFTISADLSICLPVGNDMVCIPDGQPLRLLENEHIPICYLGLDDISGNFPDFSLMDWLSERGRELGDEIGESGKDYLYAKLNIDEFMLEYSCDRKHAPYSPSVGGWNIACHNSHVHQIGLPDSISCHVTEDCKRVMCCVDVPKVDISVKVNVEFDLCNNQIVAGIEKTFDKFDNALGDYEWGTEKTKDIKKVLNIKYKIDKPAYDWYSLYLSVSVCFERTGSCLINSTVLNGLEIPRIYCVESCRDKLTKISHQCAMDPDCQGITCEVRTGDYLPVIATYFRLETCNNQVIYSVNNNKWTASLSTITDGSSHTQRISDDISVVLMIDESPTTYDVSMNLTLCGTFVNHSLSCDSIEVFVDLSLKSACGPNIRRKREIPSVLDFKTGIKELIEKQVPNEEIQRYMDTARYYQQQAKRAIHVISEIDEDDVKTSLTGLVKALGTNNPLTIPYTQTVQTTETTNDWNLEVTGADEVFNLIDGFENAIDIADKLFITGKGLTTNGIKLLCKQLANMTIGDLEALLEVNRVDPEVIYQITLDLVELATALYAEAIESATTKLSRNAFESFDITLRGTFDLPKLKGKLFTYVQWFMIGPVPCKFSFGSDFYLGMEVGVGVRVLGMVAETSITPYGGLSVWGRAEVGSKSFLYAKLELIGHIMQIGFPTYAELAFSKFPFDVGLRMDMELIPLELKLIGLASLTIKIPFCCKKTKILYKATIWQYKAPSITKEIFNKEKKETDESPPQFSKVVANSRKRSVTDSQLCIVEQLPDRDYTEPAFQISVAAIDDKSQLRFFLDVGTTPGGTDTLHEFQLGGALTKLNKNLKHTGVPLYFTMHAQNSQGTRSSVSCQLHSYDVTVPSGRVKSDFSSSSNPAILRASAVAHDETPLLTTHIGIGFGESIYGDQVIPWHAVNLEKTEIAIQQVADPGFNLVHFAGMEEGRLIGGVIQSHIGTQRVSQCAQKCLDLAQHSCLSFNYDFGKSGLCELLKAIEGHDHQIAKDGLFSHYERLGIGNSVEIEQSDLRLQHNYLYELNLDMINTLGYRNIITTKGTLIDFITPEPGLINNKTEDYLEFVPCLDLISEDRPDWERYCIGVDQSIMNHRVVVDGAMSGTVFNGMVPLDDMRFTRIDNYISANWDGFHDNETGILGYTWAIGTTYCEDMIHPHLDPHRHLLSETQWNHMGQIYPIPHPYTKLPDGQYYVTVRALNRVEFGGPLTLSVCHTTPYVVDTSHPLVNELFNIKYDERSFFIYADFNISDPHSGISEFDICIGKTSRTCDMLPWYRYDYETQQKISHRFEIPSGTPAWLRIRAVNNVQLTTVNTADQAIVVDSTPPIAGTVNDGPEYKTDAVYSKDSDKICFNWMDFYDPESGLSGYMVGVGTSPGKTDVASLREISYKSHSTCLSIPSDKTLEHGSTYYGVVWAINGGIVKRNVSSNTNGVTIDLTKPVAGDIADGNDDNFIDMQYSSSKANVAVQWRNFIDHDSGIKKFEIHVGKKIGTAVNVLQDWTTFSKDSSSAAWFNFHLKQNDFIVTSLKVRNGASNEIVSETNGFLVDLTAPEMLYIGDGLESGHDLSYQSEETELSVNFNIQDLESGLEVYRFQIIKKYNGQSYKIWPDSSEWFEETNIGIFTYTFGNLNLDPGAVYVTRIGAHNKAGIVGTYETNGVILDMTGPLVRWFHVGVLFGEMEDTHEGYVYQADHHGIKMSWLAFDQESGIETIKLSIGTRAGLQDIYSETTYGGVHRDMYLTDLQLANTDMTTMEPVYYVTLTIMNGAGQLSEQKTSTPIVVVPEDIPGIAIDGMSTEDNIFEHDIDYQFDTHTISTTFSGFSSTLHDITSIVCGVGTTPESEDIKSFSEFGLASEEEIDEFDSSINYSGYVEIPATLDQGQHYYTTVRAVTNNGHVLTATTDGFMVDTTPPDIQIERLLDTDLEDTFITRLYTSEATHLHANWRYSDTEVITEEVLDNIDSTWYNVGTFPMAYDVTNVTRQLVTSKYEGKVTDSSILLSDFGVPNIFSVKVRNKAGLSSSIYSPSVIVDTTAPNEGLVTCPQYAQPNIPVRCSWTPFIDDESPVVRYEGFIGTVPGISDVFSVVTVSGDTTSLLVHEYDIISSHEDVYYATVTAYNSVGIQSSAFSDAINIDTTPPVIGTVIELAHQHGFIDTGHNDVSCSTRSDCLENDAICQESLTSISVAWQSFVDEESQIAKYYMAIGSSHGATDILEYFQLTELQGTTTYTVHSLNLQGFYQVFIKIMAVNGAGLTSASTSNGVYLSYVSQGLAPLTHIGVWDADIGVDGDVDYQAESSQLSAGWDVSGDPCPVVKYEWSLERMDGVVVQNYTDSTGFTKGSNDQLNMKHGESYYSLLRVTNAIGYTYTLRSDGVTIHNQPLAPGKVYDGDIFGYDLNVLPSKSMVTCNWEDFGVPITETAEEVITGNTGVSNDTPDNQKVSHYEVALGTDRRFPQTRTNIVGFKIVGLKTDFTFKALDLIPATAKYYCTVRAYSTSLSSSEVSSNGFHVTFNGGVTAGSISLPTYITSSTIVAAQWDGFTSEEDMMIYYVALSDHDGAKFVDCKQMVDGGNVTDDEKRTFFTKQTVTNVGSNTYTELIGLDLYEGQMYYLFVMGIDFAGECNMTISATTVDLTEPTPGVVTGGPYYNMGSAFTSDQTAVTTKWEGYKDDVSGIRSYIVSLWSGDSCNDEIPVHLIVDDVILEANISSFTFADLSLEVDIPYFIKLDVINGAGLSISRVTSPVLYDNSAPTAGLVIDGTDYLSNVVWWGSTSQAEGTFLHYQSQEGVSCPSQYIQLNDTLWAALNGPMLTHTDGNEWNLNYLPQHMKYDEQTGYIRIKMSRDSKSSNMLSGGYTRNADFEDGGIYEVKLEAASGDPKVVTEIVLIETDNAAFQTHFYTEEGDWTEEECLCCFNNDQNTSCSCPDCAAYNASLAKIDTEPDSETNSEDNKKNGCGLQIYPGDNPYSVTYCQFEGNSLSTMQTRNELKFDPVNGFHAYRFEFKYIKEDMLPQLCLTVFADDEQLSYICGIPEFGPSTNIILHVWNSDMYLPELVNELDSWETFATVSSVMFPPAAGELCRYGEPFRGGNIPIVRYEAGIGTSPDEVDVSPFSEVVTPCIPCTDQCSRYNCDSTCDASEVLKFDFTLNNLQLEPLITQDNETSIAVYYIIVKAVLGSGVSVMSSTDGLYVDMTPPVFDKDVLIYIDVLQGEFTPASFQGASDNIKAVWLCEDSESEIQAYEWAIGSSVGATDIQSFISTGINPSGENTELGGILVHNGHYFISVKCTNEAGLTTTYQDDTGVTVLLESPNPADVGGHIIGADEFDYDIYPPDAMKSNDPTTVGSSWTISTDPSIRRYDFCCGSSTTTIDDIFPCTWVGYNASGEVKLENGNLMYNGQKMYSINELRMDYTSDVTEDGTFRMEPGRVIFIYIKLCNEAHKCGVKSMGTVTITSDNTKSGVSDGQSAITLTLTEDSRKRAVPVEIDFTTPSGVQAGETILLSRLTDEELTADYRSDASLDFVPYIVDPSVTKNKTERLLRGRLENFEVAFTVVPVGQVTMPGPVQITHTQINTDPSIGDEIYILVHWNPDAQEWQISSRTCLFGNDTEISNETESTTKVKVCKTRTNSNGSIEQYFGEETQFALFTATADVLNNPPQFTSEYVFTIQEDQGTFAITLQAEDPDNDPIVFRLVNTDHVFVVDTIELSQNGTFLRDDGPKVLIIERKYCNFVTEYVCIPNLSLTPCKHCFGIAVLDVEIYDVPAYDEIESNSTLVTITVNITSVNDPPSVFLTNEQGTSIILPDVTDEIRIYRDDVVGVNVKETFWFGAYDYDTVDNLELIHEATAQGLYTLETEVKTYDEFHDCNTTMCFGQILEAAPNKMSWVFGKMTYFKDTNFTGIDTIKMVVRDSTATLSDVVTVAVYNLDFHCMNGGYCAASGNTPCNDPLRLSSFDDNYVCVCTREWAGAHCDIDVDECITSPCAAPTVCRNLAGSYQCYYPLYFIIPLVIGCVAVVVAIAVLVYKHKYGRSKKKAVDQDLQGDLTTFSKSGSAPPVSTLLANLPFAKYFKSKVSGEINETSFVHPKPNPMCVPPMKRFIKDEAMKHAESDEDIAWDSDIMWPSVIPSFPVNNNRVVEYDEDDYSGTTVLPVTWAHTRDVVPTDISSPTTLSRPGTGTSNRPDTAMSAVSTTGITFLPNSAEEVPEQILLESFPAQFAEHNALHKLAKDLPNSNKAVFDPDRLVQDEYEA